MTIVFEREEAPRINQSIYTEARREITPEGSLLGAAFRLENDVVNALEWLNRDPFPADPQFEFVDAAKRTPLFQNYPDAFAGARSQAEWNYRLGKLQQELKDRALLRASGGVGIVAAMFAGIASPTILIPAGNAARAATVAKAAAQTAGWTMFAAGLQEGVLYTNQLARTKGESAIAVGGAAVLGGILGSAVRYLDPLQIDRIADDMASNKMVETISSGEGPTAQRVLDVHGNEVKPESLSAAATPEELAEDTLPQMRQGEEGRIIGVGPGLTRAAAKMSPLFRLTEGSFDTYRWFANQISGGGLMRRGAVEGKVVAEGGTVESRIKQWQGRLVTALRGQREAFRRHLVSTNKDSFFRRWFPTAEYREFMHETTAALRLELEGKTHPLKEVRESAQVYKEKVLLPLVRQARELDMRGFRGRTDEELLKRALQQVNADKVARELDVVREIIRRHSLEVLWAKNQKLSDAELAALRQLSGKDFQKLVPADFDDLADAISRKITNRFANTFQRHATVDSQVELPEDAWEFYYIDPTRVWDNGRTFNDFLEQDMEKIARSYVRSLAADLELQRRFGTPNPAGAESKDVPFWSEVLQERDEKLAKAKSQKEIDRINAELRAAEQDVEVLVSRLRGTRGAPTNPYAIGFRLGKGILQFNTIRLMGMVVPQSVADLARTTLKYGLLDTFRYGVAPLLRGFKQFKLEAQEMPHAGVAVDYFIHGRSNLMADIFEETEYGNLAERGLQAMTGKMGLFAGFDFWNQGMKMFAGHVLIGKMMSNIDMVVKGAAKPKHRAFLAALNLTDDDIRAIYKAVRTKEGGSEVSRGVFFPNTEGWTDEVLVDKFRAAIAQAVDDVIVTPGVERPAWVDTSTTARLIAQFRSFTFSSTYKTALAAVQDARVGNMAPVITGSVFSLALGMLSYYLWASSFGPDSPTYKRMRRELEDAIKGDRQAMARWADEAIDRSGLIGVLAEVRRFGQNVPWLQNTVTIAQERTARSPYNAPIQEMLGPTFGGAIKAAEYLILAPGNINSTAFRKAKQFMPYQNIFWLRWALDKVNEQAMDIAGVPRR